MSTKMSNSSKSAPSLATSSVGELVAGSSGNLVELAQRIRQRRLDRRMTIEQLASGTGLTRSWLSKVENFRVTPSLPALFKIAASLGTPLSELVEGLEDGQELCIVRKGEGKEFDRDPSPDNDIHYESLAHRRQSRAMEPFLLTIPPKGGRAQLLPHDGEEFLMVISGSPAFDYGNDKFVLGEGDCLYFNGSTPHRVYNPSNEVAKVLCVFLVSN